jgi:hypothetical protein
MRLLLRLLVIAKVALWPAWAIAAGIAQLTLGQAVGEITTFEWLVVIALISLGGLASVLQRISDIANDARERSIPMPSAWGLALTVATHFVGSWLAGLMAFFYAQHRQMPGFYIALFVPAASFGSIKFVQFVYDKSLLAWSGLTGKSKGA